AQINVSETRVIDANTYRALTTFVSEKLETSYPAIQELGFQDSEGMLLEQVVLRRRFFTQAISAALGANGIGDGPSHLGLYDFQARIDDLLLTFFDQLNLPSLALLSLPDYLSLRERARRVLPEVVNDLL